MKRDEWYQHKMLDCIQDLSEYVELIQDGATETYLTDDEVDAVYHSLCVLQSDITRQMMKTKRVDD